MKDAPILIVEDEIIIAENLKLILNDYGYSQVTIATNDQEAISSFQETNFKLVLMDINLGERSSLDGIDLIKVLSEQYKFLYIYITANADKATVGKAKTTQPESYIVKPFVNSSIYANVEMVLNQLTQEQVISYYNKGISYPIKIKDIAFAKAENSYICVFMTDGKKYLIRSSISNFTDTYSSHFIKIHKSYAVNKKKVEGYNSQHVIVNQERLPIGRTYKADFIKEMKDILP